MRLWHIDRVDFALAAITFFLVLALDLLPAMLTGITLSVIYIVYRISCPGQAVLGQVAATGDYEAMAWQYGRRSGTTHSAAEAVPGVIIYRFGGPLVFANAEAFKKTGEALLIKAGAEGTLPHTLVIDCEEIFLVDTSGAAALTNLLDYAQRYDVDLALARVHSGTHQLLHMAGVMDTLGEEHIYTTVRHAVEMSIAAATTPNKKQGAGP